MATKIRLARRGRKKRPIYDVVVADSRSPRDGKFIEKLGSFNPNVHPPQISIDNEKAFQWVMTGAQPTQTARKILSIEGIMMRKHLQVGVNKGAITQDQADEKFAAWLKDKELSLKKQLDKVVAEKDKVAKAALEAEVKVNQERAEAIAKKNAPEEMVAEAQEEAAEPTTVEAPAEEAPATEESGEEKAE